MKRYITPKVVVVEADTDELMTGSLEYIFLEATDQTMADPNAEILGKGTSDWDSWE